jgi:hypothetical protein
MNKPTPANRNRLQSNEPVEAAIDPPTIEGIIDAVNRRILIARIALLRSGDREGAVSVGVIV